MTENQNNSADGWPISPDEALWSLTNRTLPKDG